MSLILSILLLNVVFPIFGLCEGEGTKSKREILAERKFEELYKDASIPQTIKDAEIYELVNKLVYGELYQQGQLSDKDREMITLATITTLQTNTVLRTHVYSALNSGLTPIEITETIFHCTPYIGVAKVLEAISMVNDVFKEKNIPLPESQSTVTEETRYDKGTEAQTAIFGDMGNVKPGEGEIRLGGSFLPDYCFGDFYTRTGLTLEQHELLTWVSIATLGGCESQLKSHTNGNKNLGKTQNYLIEVLTDMMPYIGYPRTLNALAIINDVYGQNTKNEKSHEI